MPVSQLPDGWGASVEKVVRERADLTRSVLGTSFDGNFSAKSAQTLTDLANFVSKLGLDDPRLYAMKVASPGQDEWVPGEHAGTVLASAGYCADEIKPDDLLSEIVAANVEDLIQAHSAARIELTAEAARAHAEALAEAEEEKAKLTKERDEALGDLEAERSERRLATKHLEHAKEVIEALGLDQKPKLKKVRPIPNSKPTGEKPKTKKAEVGK